MSRGGGRGGGRGGRGGARGGRPQLPWDTGDEPDAKPSELFPPYIVPSARELSATEASCVKRFLLLRHQIHSSPLYTAKRTSAHDPTAPRKMYGQAQMNAVYGIKNKASVDPFCAVPTYSHKFVREDRALPDWSRRPICDELFPAELLETVDASDPFAEGGVRKKRRLELSKVRALPSAEEAFGMPSLDDDMADGDEPGRGNLLEKLDALQDDDGDRVGDIEEDDGMQEEEEDEAYDDEDAGDYNAENYFDNGDEEFGDDYGDDGGGDDATF
ncbi:DNA-directed RNA polymerase III, subunit Rpc31 [Stachybotrys elegans]|uniref:DNA-directed RNA polymerase III subunit n=1 Tax=Stachybotrys elegans TaxID=80388 RepID=A0A8K0WSZ9_9HYPO|nr:DNA-directed RNA polymerase III, subunit Rpc31 [Stachybotrys elegans]